ncbi:MAG TPA: phosphoenolpyruvate carboxykinase (ATP) [Lentisphaeria bacterium]|nr:phosphoenolpyruvate carboxykinase (ATP) [Lentisphaeria bacterium]
MAETYNLEELGITPCGRVHRNLTVDEYYELAVVTDNCKTAQTGALVAFSGDKTGRSPADKRVVEQDSTKADVWWGNINKPISDAGFTVNHQSAIAHISSCENIYIVDGFIGWDPDSRIKARVICTRAYHALFMHNMMIRPTADELAAFGQPDWHIFNAGQAESDPNNDTVSSTTSVCLDFERQEQVILGTDYAGEMKKGMFTVMNYILPKRGISSMHCSANESLDGKDVALFFGLSGTGKTTLSADPNRALIGDDEHGWDSKGIFNFEGGCYAKMIDLSQEGEPQIWNAIRKGTVLENVILDADGAADYSDTSITENTRGAYPVEFIDNAKIPCVGDHPTNVIFLTCDAFGVMPPVSRLNAAQAQYHFISGYTAKVAGTEVGVTEPEPMFSACFGGPFLVWHPFKYAELLAEACDKHNASVWLINTGWSGGAYGVGKRFSLKYTRAIVTAILNGSLDDAEFIDEPYFGLAIPTTCNEVPKEMLNPKATWADQDAYDAQAKKLGGLFAKNFEKYAEGCSDDVRAAGPNI